MARTFLLAVILSVLILFAASAAATPESLICEINKIRAKNGLLPYALSEKIIKAAQIHTNYMIKTKTVEHNQNNGLDFHERLTSVGLKYSDSAENLGGGFKSDAAILKNYWMRARRKYPPSAFINHNLGEFNPFMTLR
ncbi:hypothetical protein BC937DRAFT_91752 [Endogone sp. FLAS-F59071]|nr:hypothetical protein BC937DRAFT_91752 [Endogone sp. FLAS-F59071]|eukprot:RUS23167.1 hypothetical protein BC937DRAFT_91752 [Endogone sp. FLAS-F59071]